MTHCTSRPLPQKGINATVSPSTIGRRRDERRYRVALALSLAVLLTSLVIGLVTT